MDNKKTPSKEKPKEKPINMDKLNPKFKFEVAEEPGGENIKRCFACATCTTICPVFESQDAFDPRKIIRMVLLGMKEEVLKSKFIWMCSGCYSCYELCPRDVKITSVMDALRNIAVREGYAPEAMKASVDQLEKYGRLLEVSEFENSVRAKKEIPELKLTIPEIKELIKKVGIRKVLGMGDKNE